MAQKQRSLKTIQHLLKTSLFLNIFCNRNVEGTWPSIAGAMSLGRAMSDKALALEEQISFVCVPNGLPATSDDEDRRRSHLGQQQQQQQQGISTNSVVCEQVEDCSDKSSDSGIDMPQVSMMLGMLKRTLSDEEEGGGGAVMVDGTEQSLMAVLSPSPVDDEEEDEEEEERIKYFLQCFDEKVTCTYDM